jgi:pre-rRNA-processing protein TSR4
LVVIMNDSKKLYAAVQLGFSVPFEDQEHRSFVGHNVPMWRDWDGGQIGGRPSWLQPRDLPKDFITCKNCQEPMCFICQLYAPADEVNPDAFHRSMYLFGCPSAACARTPSGSIRVLRTQLPRENPFYPEEQESDTTWAMHLPEAWDVNLCKVCGQQGHGACPVQGFHFCGKHHQKEYKKHIFDKQQQLSKSLDFSFLPSVCTESELVVEEEPLNAALSQEQMNRKADKALFPSKEEGKEDADKEVNGEKDDEDLEQDDLNAMTGADVATVSEDPDTMEFYSKVNGVPNVQEQCLRYLKWPDQQVCSDTSMPLWISSEDQPKEIPECPYCGAERKFEFQIMPQLLHYLLKDHEIHRSQNEVRNSIGHDAAVKEAIKKASSIMEQAPQEQVPPSFAEAKEKAVNAMRSKLMDGDKELTWGVIAVYTCTASCGGLQVEEGAELGAYREEFAWKQPSLD